MKSMDPDNTIIATAAKTPLYFPLYLAKEKQFYGLLSEYKPLSIDEAPLEVDGDGWALDRLADHYMHKNVRFAVCDPLQTYNFPGTVVVATLIAKAAFWLVDRKSKLRTEADFACFDKLWTYPEGMSAFWIAKMAEERCHQNTEWVSGVKRGDELRKFRDTEQSAAMTADILQAIRITKEPDSKFKIKYSWPEHPEYSDFMLTGLVTTEEMITTNPGLIKGMIRALYRAIHELRLQQNDTLEIFQRTCNALPDEAGWVIQRFNNERIYPDSVVPTIASWHNAFKIYSKIPEQHGHRPPNEDSTTLFTNHVRPQLAKDVEQEFFMETFKMEDALRTLNGRVDQLETRQENSQLLKQRVESVERKFREQTQRARFLSGAMFGLLVLVALLSAAGHWFHWTFRYHLVSGGLAAICFAWALKKRGATKPDVKSWDYFEKYERWYREVWLALILAVVVGVAIDYFRPK